MREENEDVPSDAEVVSQLDRICASPHFSNSATQSALLSFVVRKAIEREVIKESDIGFKIFTHYDSKSHKVRVNASLVRGKIDRYYKNEGKDDLVRIDLPPGPAYKPEFSYHISAQAVRAYERALAYQKRLSVYALSEAELLLSRAIKLAPGYAPSHAAKAETFLLRSILDHVFEVYPGASGWVIKALRSAENAVRLDPRSWLGHIVLGVAWLLAYDRKQAKREFSSAIAIDSRSTGESLWYAAYLMITGRIDEGLQVVKSKANDDFGSFEIRLVYAFFLYAARSYESAETMLYQVVGAELGEPLQQLLGALIEMANGHPGEARAVMLEFISSEMDEQWDRPTASLMSRTDVPRKNDERWVLCGKYFYRRSRKGPPPERFPGLAILSLADAGLIQKAKEKMAVLRKQKPVRPLQLALGYMAVGNEARALAALRRASWEGDIFVHWLHLLPLFDRLRSHPRFQEILDAVASAHTDDKSQ